VSKFEWEKDEAEARDARPPRRQDFLVGASDAPASHVTQVIQGRAFFLRKWADGRREAGEMPLEDLAALAGREIGQMIDGWYDAAGNYVDDDPPGGL
jgi:hypothetical protein